MKSFSQVRDIVITPLQRKDNNGQICALVKVVIPSSQVVFEGSLIGDCEYKISEYWCYLPAGRPPLKIKHPDCEPLLINFGDLEPGGLRCKGVYELVISLPDSNSPTRKPDVDHLGDSPFYSVKNINEKISIRNALKECKTVVLGSLKSAGTPYSIGVEKAGEYDSSKFGSKNVIRFYGNPFHVLGRFHFPINRTKFIREQNKYKLLFEQFQDRPITLEIIYNPDANGENEYLLIFTNIEGEIYRESFGKLELSKQKRYSHHHLYEEDIYARTKENASDHPYLFDIIDYWREKFK